MISRIIGLLCLCFFAVNASCALAFWDRKPRFQWTESYRYDLRQDNHELFTNRISSTFLYLNEEEECIFKLTPFFEARWNIDKDLWEREELGAELGKDFFSWLYVGESIQKGWMEEDYQSYDSYEKRGYLESETRFLLSHALLSTGKIKLKGYALNEYTYDFDAGEANRNEVVVGVTMPIGKYAELNLNWRHIDRIHFYDSDTVEGSVSLVF